MWKFLNNLVSQEYFPIALVLSYHWLCSIDLGLSVPRVLLRLHHITTREWHSTQVPYPRSAPVPIPWLLLLLQIWSLTNAPPLLIDINIHINGDPVSSQACHLILLNVMKMMVCLLELSTSWSIRLKGFVTAQRLRLLQVSWSSSAA